MIGTWHLILSAMALGCMLIAAVAAVHGLRSPRRWHGPVMAIMTGQAILVNVALLMWRAWDLGLVDSVWTLYQALTVFATLVAGLALVSQATRRMRGLHVLLLPLAAVLQAACFTALDRDTLAPTMKPWFVVHMASIVLGATGFSAGAMAGLAYLMVNRRLRRRLPAMLGGPMPSLETLEVFGRQTTWIGFVLLTFGILTGVCGVAHSGEWARYLRDPFVVFTGVAWLLYAAALVAIRVQPSLRGRRAAWLAVWWFVVLAVVFFVAGMASSTHQ